jgi:hypothetical protein
VKQVEFYVLYDGIWHSAGVVASSPYEVIWETPPKLRSQQLRFGITVVDNVGNAAVNAGGIRRVNFVESLDTSGTNENWLPTRAYLNQRSLPSGWEKCSVASMAMVLAMNSIIASDYATMAAKANDMFPRVLEGGAVWVNLMRDELIHQGVMSDYHDVSTDAGWAIIKQEVDAGRPVIIRTQHGVVTAAGHFFTAVGYRESNATREVIAYDPYGRWLGTCCQNNYDVNSTDANSRKGQWVYYDFDRVFGSSNYLITARPKTSSLMRKLTSIPSSPPDVVSDEPMNIDTYAGVNIRIGESIFLPLIRKGQ